MDGLEPIAADVSITISGPSIARAARVTVWRVQVRDSLAQPVPGFAIFAQIGHGSGRPYRGVTDGNGEVDFEFIFSAAAPSLQLQFAPAPRVFSAAERFPEANRHSVTCIVLANDPGGAEATPSGLPAGTMAL